MRILVTGAAGFIGSNVALGLDRAGHDVVAADTFLHASYANLVAFGGDVLTLRQYDDVASIRRLGPFDAIVHQSAITGVVAADGSPMTDSHKILHANVEGFRGVLDLAAEFGSRVVWASSCSVYGRGPVPMREEQAVDPLNAYAFSKVLKERLAARYAKAVGLPMIGLRYTNVYGPGEHHKGKLASMVHQLAVQMRAGKRPRIFKAGEQRRDFVYIDDVVRANLLALEAKVPGAVVANVGAGRSFSFNELVRELNRALGTRLEPEYFENPYGFTQDNTEADLSRARKLLGYEPAFDLTRGVDAYLASGKLGVAY